MLCRSDLILFLLERVRCLVQKYGKEFVWKSFLKATKILEQKAPKTSSATLVTFSIKKNCLSFFISHLIEAFKRHIVSVGDDTF